MSPSTVALTNYRLALAVGTPAVLEAALHGLADALARQTDPDAGPRPTPGALRLVVDNAGRS